MISGKLDGQIRWRYFIVYKILKYGEPKSQVEVFQEPHITTHPASVTCTNIHPIQNSRCNQAWENQSYLHIKLF